MVADTRDPAASTSRLRGAKAVERRKPARGGRRRRFVSPLTVRILALNVPALGILLGGALFLGSYRDGLVASKIEGLQTQGELIAGALGEAATDGEVPGINAEVARQLVGRLAASSATRARLFGTDGDLVADSRELGPAAREVAAAELPPPGAEGGLLRAVRGAVDWMLRVSLSQPRLPAYREAAVQRATDYAETMQALEGEPASALRALSDGETVVSVSIPVQRFKQVMGALLLSTDAGDIEEQVAEVRLGILQAFGLALAVTILLSAYLAGTLARPIRRLAQAADGAQYRAGRRNTIPDFSGRRDEIGELSAALREMTDALYERLDAIEAFAADVAHEIKNPLTSIRSAVETLSRVADPERQRRLVAIIGDDVGRLDRLISDISDASRLGAELARAERTPVDLAALAETLADLHRATREQGPEIEVRRLGGGTFEASCVEDRIGRVMRNLLANAVSFSPPGGTIVIAVAQDRDRIDIVVEDQGPGIPEDKLETVFDRFYSLRPGDEPFGTHSGLGLSISRQIVEAHGGALRAENVGHPGEPSSGARLLVSLPIG